MKEKVNRAETRREREGGAGQTGVCVQSEVLGYMCVCLLVCVCMCAYEEERNEGEKQDTHIKVIKLVNTKLRQRIKLDL